MNNKIKKLVSEIQKTKKKISEQQIKLRELESQKTELENIEIVELVRSTKMNTSELSRFLKAYHEKNDMPFTMQNKEENKHEEK